MKIEKNLNIIKNMIFDDNITDLQVLNEIVKFINNEDKNIKLIENTFFNDNNNKNIKPTLIHYVVEKRSNITNDLYLMGINTNIPSQKNEMNPLLWSIYKGIDYKELKYLLEYGKISFEDHKTPCIFNVWDCFAQSLKTTEKPEKVIKNFNILKKSNAWIDYNKNKNLQYKLYLSSCCSLDLETIYEFSSYGLKKETGETKASQSFFINQLLKNKVSNDIFLFINNNNPDFFKKDNNLKILEEKSKSHFELIKNTISKKKIKL